MPETQGHAPPARRDWIVTAVNHALILNGRGSYRHRENSEGGSINYTYMATERQGKRSFN